MSEILKKGKLLFFIPEGNDKLYQTSITISTFLQDESRILQTINWLGLQVLFTMPKELAQSEFGRKLMSDILSPFGWG